MDENICGEIQLVDNILQAEDFVRLRIETGFANIPVEHARRALQNGIILPRFQRKGIGTMIVNHLVAYARAHSDTGKFTTIGGVSAKGKEVFYEKIGFEIIPNGIRKMLEIEE